jgi:tRNA (guanine-N7-)-methyltransferase
LHEVLPRLAIDASSQAPPALAELFSPPVSECWLEIGFGGGEHLVWQARANPQVGLIGCEVFEDGVVKVLSAVDEHGLSNIRLCTDDARELLRWLPPASVARAFILFPDPWPKKRHVKRRLVNRTLFDLLARVLRPGAELRIASDIGDYLRTILLGVRRHPGFAWQADGAADWRARGPDWPQTRYEAKAAHEGRTPCFLRFLRTNCR